MRALRSTVIAATLLAATLATTATPVASAHRRAAGLIAPQASVDLVRFGDEPVSLDFGLWFAPGAGLELAAKRTRWDHPIQLTRITRSAKGIAHSLIRQKVTDFDGLPRFFDVTIADAETGSSAAHLHVPFCPNSFDRVRVDPHAPDATRFPDACGGGPWTLGQIWGIDAGWAVRVPLGTADLADGSYTAGVSVDGAWAHALGLDARAFRATVGFTVTTEDDTPPPPEPFARGRAAKPLPGAKAAGTVPPLGSRPDLVALPAWGIGFAEDDGDGGGNPGPEPSPIPVDHALEHRDVLQFAATIWNAGSAPLVVDGFRRGSSEVMDAYQSFYVDGKRVAVQKTSTFVYDPREGHEHWHFTDFATHRLLDATGSRVVLGEKEAFCIAPTDAIDLTLRGADLRPGATGFFSNCGDRGSIGLRETLQAGWGDTYGAGTVGQAFDVTDLPNGTYYIEVEANPARRLLEASTANNVTRRRIVLGGEPGSRTVWVAPYYGVTA